MADRDEELTDLERPLRAGPPRMQPVTEELLDALAYLMVENDSLRCRLNMAPRNGRLLLTAEDRARGHSTGPTAVISHGDLKVALES